MKSVLHSFIVIIIISSYIFGVDYASQIQPIFDTHCTDCHGGSAGLSLNSYSDLINGDIIIPGDSTNSILIKKLKGTASGSQMPKSQAPLSSLIINLIATWIQEGANES